MTNRGNNQYARAARAACSPLLILFVNFVGAMLTLSSTRAFTRTTFGSDVSVSWIEGQATVNLQFGCGAAPLPNWGPCWDDVAADAFARWNGVAARFRFSRQTPAFTADPCAHTDRVNTASFTSTLCGMGFGSALAVTIVVGSSATGALVDTDVVVDSSRPWSTYPGPTQRNANGTIVAYDFHRVVMHEFGHVLGLGHPDTAGQTVQALMNSRISNLDDLQTDDITGVNSIYPATTPFTDVFLENPPPGDSVSGISVISGWACDANRIEAQVDNFPAQLVAYGTQRTDTMPVCGDDNNGFSLLVNWGNYGDGAHTIIVTRDGVEFARRTFFVTTFGTDFLRGASGVYRLPDFVNGRDVIIEWKESVQNFLIIGVE